jgi:hypothetical protein
VGRESISFVVLVGGLVVVFSLGSADQWAIEAALELKRIWPDRIVQVHTSTGERITIDRETAFPEDAK